MKSRLWILFEWLYCVRPGVSVSVYMRLNWWMFLMGFVSNLQMAWFIHRRYFSNIQKCWKHWTTSHRKKGICASNACQSKCLVDIFNILSQAGSQAGRQTTYLTGIFRMSFLCFLVIILFIWSWMEFETSARCTLKMISVWLRTANGEMRR